MARHGKLTPNMAVSADGQSWIKAKTIAALSFPAAEHDERSDGTAKASATTPEDEWYVLTRHSVAGPFTRRKLRKLARRGRIQPNVAVSRDRVKWTKASRVPGIVFPAGNVELEPNAPQPPPKQIPPRQRLLPGHIEFLPAARPRQLTLFAVDAYPRPRKKACQPRLGDDWPLLHWPPEVVQLDLFDPTETSRTEQLADQTSLEPQQLELSLWIGDQPFTAQLPSPAGKRQQTLFNAGWLLPSSSDNRRRSSDDLPLFHWPSAVTQLRLFDHAADREDNPAATKGDGDQQIQKSSVPAVSTAVALHRQSSEETISSEQSPQDTQRWLHENWDQVRKSEYIRRFGACSHVARPEDPRGVPIDVYVFPANQRRPVTTLVTSGMSNRRMPVPQGRCSPRAELVLYVNEVKAEYVNLLYFLAQIPLYQHKALRYGTALHHGNPPRPIFPNSVLDGYVFMIPSVQSDFEIHQTTRIGDDSLQLLWVVPTTHAERDFLTKHGMARFCWLLDQQQHALAFDPNRDCYVRASDNVAS